MRLDELSRPSISQAVMALEAKGYERLGRGIGGEVWAKPGMATALKVFHKMDPAYLAFARMVVALQRSGNANPHFPRLWGNLINLNEHYYAVRMERLNPSGPLGASEACNFYVRNELENWNVRTPPNVEHFMEKFPQLKDACDILMASIFRRYSIDLHAGNVMFRDGGFPVITDPAAGLRKNPL